MAARVSLLPLVLGCLLALPAIASTTLNPPPAPAVGSRNIATADLLVARPTTTPCKVQLFSQLAFADFNAKPFSYTPPTTCPGPWSKVVFEGDFSVSAGVQYDRTAQILLGNVAIYYGTTSEPTSTLSPSWHVERDLTDYSALFSGPQSGVALIGNVVNSTYTGVIYGSADLEFYPAGSSNPAPPVPETVLPLNGSGAATLSSGSSQLVQTFTLPTNIVQAYLDVFAQSQSNDEFWYTCVPNDVSTELESCGNTAFREVEVTIDGQPAGVAPVYPWIFTGGINPRLWLPIPGVQTLNFLPYRVDLTPFAGLLSNGQPHSVGYSVYNANNYFAATGTLLLMLDSGSTTVSGAISTNTLLPVAPTVVENLKSGSGGNAVSGTVTVSAARNFVIAGYVDTSRGRIATQLQQSVSFSSQQQFTIAASYEQDITQSTTLSSTKTITAPSGTSITTLSLSYPLTVDYTPAATTIQQQYLVTQSQQTLGGTLFRSNVSNTVNAASSLAQSTTSQQYIYADSTNACYNRTISATLGVITGVVDRC